MLFVGSIYAYSQGSTIINGHIKDAAGQPVSDVVVSVIDEFTQVTSNINGAFSIKAEPGKILYFSKIGYAPEKFAIAGKNDEISITLKRSSTEKMYQVGYGVRTQSSLTSSISTISSDDLSKAPVSTLGNAVQGLASGLTVLRSVGAEPGWDQPSLYIRGVQTFGGGSSPLVMVDDVERDFTQLDPEEIESITILKDAAAVAMYGMRGANGVINVKTKRGFVGKPVITFTAQYGTQSPTRLPKYLGSADYVKYRNLALRNDYSKLSDAEFNDLFLNDPKNNPDNYDGSNPYRYANSDWYNEYIKDNAPQQIYKLSFRGGNDVAQYYVMLGGVNQEGLYNHTEENNAFSTQNKFTRYNFRSVVDVNLSSALKVGVNLGGRVENRHTPNSSASSIITAISQMPPTIPFLNRDGSISGTSVYRSNPLGLIARSGFSDRFSRYLQGTITADMKLDAIVKGLSANGLFGFDAIKEYGRSKSQSFAVYQPNADDTTYTAFGEDKSPDLNYSGWNSAFDLMTNYMFGLSYNRSFGYNEIAADIKYMQSDLMVDGDNPDYRNQGVFGRATYTYDKRYAGEFGFAYNGSENFAKGKRFGFFPTVSGAWVISNEEFMKENELITFMKLRGSYGLVGNSNIGIGYRYPFEEKFYSGSGYFFGTSNTDGSYEGRIPNNNITWEESKDGNIGLEIEFLKKVSIDIDAFRNDRTQIITGRWNTLPTIIGQDLPYDNKGSVLSQGFELTISHSNKISDFGYNIQGNISLAKNKITYMEEVSGLNSWEYKTNRPVMQQWGLEVAPGKFFADQEDIDNWAKSTYGLVQPGDVKYVDQNNDGIIDSQDYVPLGKPSVPEWNFGLNVGLQYKGFDLNVLFAGTANRSVFISNSVLWGMQNNNNITAEVADNSWGVSNDPKYPRLTTQLNAHNYQSSSMWLRNVDFLRVQTLEFGYSLPKNLLMKANINDVRFFVNGYNLFSFDSLRKLNLSAEIPDAGVTMYPETRVINVGTSLKF